jgi:excisionase family DNA binding protein
MAQDRIDVPTAARRLNVSRQTVYRLIHCGKLKGAAFGLVKGYQIWVSSIEEYEREKEEEAGVYPT